ncbi:MAG: efflux RND transporter periplasmic adaptor subunit [Myxococcota bacterium]
MSRPLMWVAVAALTACGTGRVHDDSDDGHDGHEEAFSQIVEVSSSAAERAGIKIETAGRSALFGGVEVPAEIQLDPDRTAHVSSIVQGQIADVSVSIGARVEAGDTLCVLRSVALGETRADLAEARAELEVARANHERESELQEAGIGARRNLVEAQGALERARARLSGLQSRARVYGGGGRGSQTVIRSPIAGEVLQRHATRGEVVEPGTMLFEIADLSEVWVMGQVFAQDVSAARLGAPGRLTLRSLPGREWSGPLDYVSPALDGHTRTLPVRITLSNEDRTLRPGSFGVLRLPGAENPPEVPVIAAAAVQEIDGERYVFVPEDDAHYRAVAVRTGRRDGPRVEVLAGLIPGDRYVAAGAFVLKSTALSGELGEHGH